MVLTQPISSPPPIRHLSVVVADDVAGILDLVGGWLREAGCVVHCVSSGNEVTKLLRREHVDLIILDVIMPDGDGLDVIMDLKRTQPEARVLAISGGGRHLQASDCLRIAKGLGAHEVLLKPFNREQLLAAVERVTQSGT